MPDQKFVLSDYDVGCEKCKGSFYEEHLEIFTDEENGKISFFKGCPNCGTDDWLKDIDGRDRIDGVGRS
jgi:hypothetical protein